MGERAFYYKDSLDKQKIKLKEYNQRAKIAHNIIMQRSVIINVQSREKADANLRRINKCNNSKK